MAADTQGVICLAIDEKNLYTIRVTSTIPHFVELTMTDRDVFEVPSALERALEYLVRQNGILRKHVSIVMDQEQQAEEKI